MVSDDPKDPRPTVVKVVSSWMPVDYDNLGKIQGTLSDIYVNTFRAQRSVFDLKHTQIFP
jgi:hypothetical protein